MVQWAYFVYCILKKLFKPQSLKELSPNFVSRSSPSKPIHQFLVKTTFCSIDRPRDGTAAERRKGWLGDGSYQWGAEAVCWPVLSLWLRCHWLLVSIKPRLFITVFSSPYLTLSLNEAPESCDLRKMQEAFVYIKFVYCCTAVASTVVYGLAWMRR